MNHAHYESFLSEIYDWMQGGWDHNTELQRALIRDLGLTPRPPTQGSPKPLAIDVGAGTGYLTIALAEAGYRVVAIDPSESMLARLATHIGENDITLATTRLADHSTIEPTLIACTGDTLAHFESHADVEEFVATAARLLPVDGRLLLGYRDSSKPVRGVARFIPIRSDADTIFTCFLESEGDRIRVHDIVHRRDGEGFNQTVSTYLKIRLDPNRIDDVLQGSGFTIVEEHRAKGVVTTLAKRSA